MPVGEKKVEQPIVVVIQKPRTPAEERNRRVGDSRRVAHIGKTGVAIVAVERVVVVGKIRDAEIDFAIAVVIADRNSHRGLLATLVIQRKS